MSISHVRHNCTDAAFFSFFSRSAFILRYWKSYHNYQITRKTFVQIHITPINETSIQTRSIPINSYEFLSNLSYEELYGCYSGHVTCFSSRRFSCKIQLCIKSRKDSLFDEGFHYKRASNEAVTSQFVRSTRTTQPLYNVTVLRQS